MNNFILSLDIDKLKKVFKKVFCALLITLFLWFFKLCVVNAATFAPFDFSIAGNSNLPQDQWVDNGMSKILTVATSLQENNLNINERNYVEIFACVAGGPSWSSYITNDDLNGAFQNGAVNSLNTGISCKTTNQSYNGSIFKFYFKIYKWRISSGADLYDVSSYWRFNSSEASLLLDIRDIKITDKDNFFDDSILVSNGKGQDIIINQNNSIINKFDDIINSDISDKDKELPDDSNYDDYNKAQDSLTDKVKQADLSNINIGIDKNASSFVWDTLTSFLQSSSLVFSVFIAILSIGIIKLALGR